MWRAVKSVLQGLGQRFSGRGQSSRSAKAGETHQEGRKSLAVFTMVYNEHQMLPVWARHYVRQARAGNVYVLDHGSDHLPDLPGCQIITLPRDELDEIDRAAQVASFQKTLLERYKFVLFTDCDELLVARPSHYLSLQDYVAHTPYKTIRCVGVDVMQQEAGLPPVQWEAPILAQRPYGAVRSWSCKTLLSSVPLAWNPGFHTCQQPSVLDTDLWMFHLKYADQTHMLERLALTRQLKWSARALQTGHGGSHRVSNRSMIRFLEGFQGKRQETDLDSLDLRAFVETGTESALHRIPSVFLKSV
ncbi:hypothetical protein ATPR_2877 [Acetobacter tropicalis NBRC 101654]|uniref:Glycosyl transferase family 2 n=1 Tax=Acetobacter tropicalis NBRC 101654 TaxID=749388 RepID=F7VHM8_9PROT|nr:glycosyltransferase family 2 protein [Acetobacter tropicalis]GAA09873.1 hypothetical protein ATPR_2877 [Acetobacter tropicalis NBRC 101654]